MFITRGVYELCVAVPPGVAGQDEAGRLWDVVWMLRFAIMRSQPGMSRLTVALYVRKGESRGSGGLVFNGTEEAFEGDVLTEAFAGQGEIPESSRSKSL